MLLYDIIVLISNKSGAIEMGYNLLEKVEKGIIELAKNTDIAVSECKS